MDPQNQQSINVDSTQNLQMNNQINQPQPMPGNWYKYGFWVMTLIVLFIVGGLVYIRYFGAFRSGNDVVIINDITGTPPSVSPTSQSKTFQSQNNYSFSYPSKWNIRVINVKKGEKFQEGPHEYTIMADDTGESIKETFYDIDVYAQYADMEYVILMIDPNWQLRFGSFKSNTPYCSFNQEMGPDEPMLSTLKQLKNNSFNLSRQAYEKGWMWTAPGPAGSEAIPRSQFVFKRHEGINALNVTTTYLDSCIFNSPKQTQLEIEYVSPFFTGINFPEDKMGTEKPIVIDTVILDQMDAVVESLDF